MAEKYKEINSELVKNILEEAAKINQNIILPFVVIMDGMTGIWQQI